jgi:hypothetical protein
MTMRFDAAGRALLRRNGEVSVDPGHTFLPPSDPRVRRDIEGCWADSDTPDVDRRRRPLEIRIRDRADLDAIDDQINALVFEAHRANIWKDASVYSEVWAESRSIASLMRDDCQELRFSLHPSGGFSSLTHLYYAARYIADAVAGTDRSIEIIYIGDLDPASVWIDRVIEKRLRTHLAKWVPNPLTFYRIAITPEQIRELDLPSKPRATRATGAPCTSPRRSRPRAMPAHMLRELLRAWVESFMPQGALEVARVAEENERQNLAVLADLIDKADRS